MILAHDEENGEAVKNANNKIHMREINLVEISLTAAIISRD